MGAYCTLAYIRRHPARLGEIMEVRRLSTYYDEAVFGDRGEIACIPHKGCLLEIVAAGAAAHPEVNQLLPGQVIRYTRSFFFGDRFELPSGTRVGLAQLVGFKLQLAPPRTAPLPEEGAIVQRATRALLFALGGTGLAVRAVGGDAHGLAAVVALRPWTAYCGRCRTWAHGSGLHLWRARARTSAWRVS